MPQQSDDFADVLERAQRVTPGDVGDPFAGTNAYVPGRGRPHDLEYDAHIKVFFMPADAADYEEVMNQCLRGEAVQRYEEKTFTKEGDFVVAFCWLTQRPRAAQAVNAAAGDAEPEVRPEKLA